MSFFPNTSPPPPLLHLHYAIADTGCSSHFIVGKPSSNTTADQTITVILPNGSTMSSDTTTTLNLPHLTPEAKQAHVFPDLHKSLVSIGQLCDAGCTATFNKTSVTVHKNNNIVVTGTRNTTNGLWEILLPPNDSPNVLTNDRCSHRHVTPLPEANSVYTTACNKELVQFLHRTCFSPTVSTWIDAIAAGFFATWPGLTVDLVRKHLPPSEATTLGHMRQTYQNTRSTQPKTESCSNLVYAATFQPTGHIYSDQTGRFPHTSSRGNKYIMIVYDYDSNAILAEPMKSKAEAEMIKTYRKMHATLTSRGLKPILQTLDNECSQGLQSVLNELDIKFQLVPPGVHRRNAVERAIATFKDHFIAGLATTHKLWPIHLWCRLIPQAILTLNMLRASRLNPKLSADTHLNGIFDFNKTPMAPPGTRIIAHDKPNTRPSWAPHGSHGWYLGPAMNHYRCYRVFIEKTASERISDTVQFFSETITTPTLTHQTAILQAAKQLTATLAHNPTHLQAHIGLDQTDALLQLTSIFDAFTSHYKQDNGPKPALPKRALPRVIPQPSQTVPPHMTPHRYPTRSKVNMANAVIDAVTGSSFEYRHLTGTTASADTKATWQTSFSNEIGRLAQGVGTRMPSGSDTIHFIPHHKLPTGRFATYGRLVVSIRPGKSETHRTRLTVGGNLIHYPDDVSTPTADITTAKVLFNSVISTPNARFLVADVKDFYLNTEMERYEYMKLPLTIFPDEICHQYQLTTLVHTDGYVYMEIRKGMYGLPQAGILANQKLTKHLAQYGYEPTPHTPGLWRHQYRPITFSLVVDDFGIKYINVCDAEHLLHAIQQEYIVTTNWSGSVYCGLHLAWNYPARKVTISMPGYIRNALKKFKHSQPAKPEHSPHTCTKPAYGTTVQAPIPDDDSPTLPAADINRIQQIVGTLLYYARAVDPTLLVALNSISAQQSAATRNTALALNKLLNYVATHPDAAITYEASDMILHIDSDASYLSLPQARSRAGGYFYLSAASINPFKPPTTTPPINGAIHVNCNKLQHVMASAAEAEVGAIFLNCQDAVGIRTLLHELGHPQPNTPVKTDNATASGLTNATMKPRRSKTMDMRFHWIRDRIQQGQFLVYWRPGIENLADYFTKHFPAAHHQLMRHVYLQPISHEYSTTSPTTSRMLQGCINPGKQTRTTANQSNCDTDVRRTTHDKQVARSNPLII